MSAALSKLCLQKCGDWAGAQSSEGVTSYQDGICWGSLVQLVPKVTSSTELGTGLRYPSKHCHLHMCDCCQLWSQMRSIMSWIICSHLMKLYNTWWAGYLVWVQSGTSNVKHLYNGIWAFPRSVLLPPELRTW